MENSQSAGWPDKNDSLHRSICYSYGSKLQLNCLTYYAPTITDRKRKRERERERDYVCECILPCMQVCFTCVSARYMILLMYTLAVLVSVSE